ncbi:DUF1804 family protein [Methylogaea oryzae]|uniref:DUF1804 family protein n=1 Tax=Methylogaea oryzae TaxID=1295382 RepID=A0A8D4VML3_9GAMM|nr:DUF1804 family protein [Methylogaea oryzae]BBL70341.1 hypothetical protein MoryE10_09470 [Methylogaea oryzae]
MAHDKTVVSAVRKAYIYEGLALPAAAKAKKVSEATARRWKTEAAAAGDDWDKARGAQLLAGGSVEEVLRQTLAVMIRQVQATIQAIEADEEMAPAVKVQLLGSSADASAKLVASMRRMMPETDALAVRMDTLKKLAEFVRVHYPQHVAAFAELLQPFGEELARG